MKKLSLILLFAAFTLILGIGNAKALVMDSVPLLMIDGNDPGVTVDILASNTVTNFAFGYLNASGSFSQIINIGGAVGFDSFLGGQVVDFAIRNASGDIYSLSGRDTNGNSYATLDFSGPILSGNAVNPDYDFDYWNSVSIGWKSFPGYNVAIALSNGDGVAPVPEPSSMMLLGMGVLGLLGFRRKIS